MFPLHHRPYPFLLSLFAILAAAIAPSAPVTFESLIDEMVDLERLTRMPDPAYSAHQASSYDRNATDPGALNDENWFANADRGHHLRVEERNGAKEWVLMDAAGPGAVVRFWSANPADAGIIRIYLDGAAQPVVEMPLEAWLGGEGTPVPHPITGERARGWNSYLPVPYAKHCKITASAPDFYYIVNYRTYAPDTAVATWSPAVMAAAESRLRDVAAQLANPAEATPAPDANADVQALTHPLQPGDTAELFTPAGPGMVRAMTLNVDAEDLEAALRGCLLEITYDGADTPAVQAPIGDFFGTAPGPQPFQSLPSGVLADGTLYAHWPMPYRESLVLSVTNHTGAPVQIALRVASERTEVDADLLYLHAKWRAARELPTRPRRDWNFATITGTGRFVGSMLHVSNPVKQWWGEGDEKIYVDGEDFPSFFGTGSEDYFGYAWCSNQPFSHAYHNQPRCDGPANYGQTCVSRFHIMDDIPFTQSFRFDMEVWHWSDCIIDQSAMTWWYAKAGGSDEFERPEPGLLVIPDLPPPPQPMRVPGAIEGESLAVLDVTGGTATVQESEVWPWSNAGQLWWLDPAPGDRLTAALDVPEAGVYEVRAIFTRAPDYGIAQVYLGDAMALIPLDFYATSVEPTPEIALGVVNWTKGRQTITFEITGRNAQAIPRHMIGLDYIRLVQASGGDSE